MEDVTKSPDPEPTFEPGPPRFSGCPPICTAVNLPAHESKEAALAFHDKQAPGQVIRKIGLCKACGKWHYLPKCRHPSQDGEYSKLPKGFVPFRRKIRPSAFEGHETRDLPRREIPEAAPKIIEPKPKKAIMASNLGELFQRAGRK